MNVMVGDHIPVWYHGPVAPERMALMATVLRDPNPIHFEPATSDDDGTSLRINQGPLNVGYVANMLTSWAGPGSTKRLRIRFVANVFEGDHVKASGVATAITNDSDEAFVECDVQLVRSNGGLSPSRYRGGSSFLDHRRSLAGSYRQNESTRPILVVVNGLGGDYCVIK
jgi:acyl dehydratase